MIRLLVIVAAGVGLLAPIFLAGYPITSDEAVFNTVIAAEFAAQLFAGDLYPRWLMNANMGLGSPVFYMYPPVPFYLTSPFQALFAGDPYGWRALSAGTAVALIASGLACYGWLRRHAPGYAATMAAILYMAFPYHYYVDVYMRSAYAEFWSYVWMPPILMLLEANARGARYAAAGVAGLYALLIATHLPTALIFSPVMAGYALVLWWGERHRARLLAAGAAMALGILLSAVYLLPALSHVENTLFPLLGWQGLYDYANHFLFEFPVRAGRDAFVYSLDAALVVMAVFCVLLAFSREFRKDKRANSFFLAVAAISVFMALPVSDIVWQVVPLLQKIQFPWRFLAILSVAAAFAFAKLVSFERRPNPILAVLVIVNLGIAGWMGVVLPYRITEHGPPELVRANQGYIAERSANNTYWPRTSFEQRPERLRELAQMSQHALTGDYAQRYGAPIPKILPSEPAPTLVVRRWRPGDIAFAIDAPADTTVGLGHFYYPGWQARIQGRTCCLPLRSSASDGLMTIDIPAGRHLIELRIAAGPWERAGGWLSLIALMLLVAWSANEWRASRE